MTQHAQDAWTYDFIQQLCICDIGTKAKETTWSKTKQEMIEKPMNQAQFDQCL